MRAKELRETMVNGRQNRFGVLLTIMSTNAFLGRSRYELSEDEMEFIPDLEALGFKFKIEKKLLCPRRCYVEW